LIGGGVWARIVRYYYIAATTVDGESLFLFLWFFLSSFRGIGWEGRKRIFLHQWGKGEGDTILTLLLLLFSFVRFLFFFSLVLHRSLFFCFCALLGGCFMIGVAGLRDSILLSFLVCMNYYPYYLLLLLSYYYLLLWAAFSFVWLLFGGLWMFGDCGFYFLLPFVARAWLYGVCIDRFLVHNFWRWGSYWRKTW
jgi:hypothetical protein